MVTAMVSAYSGRAVRCDVAMTGEVNLRGEVMPIGGLKEKLLAARRGGIKTVLIPEENRRDLKEVPDNIKEALDIRPVRWIDDILGVALARLPEVSGEDSRADDPASVHTMISTH
jgi:ATP-dependent Lon protease